MQQLLFHLLLLFDIEFVEHSMLFDKDSRKAHSVHFLYEFLANFSYLSVTQQNVMHNALCCILRSDNGKFDNCIFNGLINLINQESNKNELHLKYQLLVWYNFLHSIKPPSQRRIALDLEQRNGSSGNNMISCTIDVLLLKLIVVDHTVKYMWNRIGKEINQAHPLENEILQILNLKLKHSLQQGIGNIPATVIDTVCFCDFF